MGGGEPAHSLCKTHTWTRIILQYLFIVRFIFRYVFLFLRLSAQCSATQHTFLFPQNVECISMVEQRNHRKKKIPAASWSSDSAQFVQFFFCSPVFPRIVILYFSFVARLCQLHHFINRCCDIACSIVQSRHQRKLFGWTAIIFFVYLWNWCAAPFFHLVIN